MRCAGRGEVSKSARLKLSPTVARRDFLTLAQRFRDNMKGNFQFVFHANSASPGSTTTRDEVAATKVTDDCVTFGCASCIWPDNSVAEMTWSWAKAFRKPSRNTRISNLLCFLYSV